MLAQTAFHRVFQLLSQMAHIRFRSRKRVHTRLCSKDRTQRITGRNRGCFRWGAITTLGAFRTFTNIPGPGIRTTYFAAFRSWSEALLKDTESLRNSDALMRVAVPQASRPRWAALLCLQLGDVTVLSLCAQYFLNVRGEGWYHYPRRALRAAETPDGRLSKRLTCRFLRSGSLH